MPITAVINCRVSNAAFFRISSWKIRKRTTEPLLKCRHWCEVIPGTHLDFLGWTSRDFSPHTPKHTTCLECRFHPFMAGSVTAIWASQIHNIRSFKYFSAFLDKIHEEKENLSVAMENVQLLPKQQETDFGNSVWCHGSIFSLVAFGRTVARDALKRNSCLTYQLLPLSLLFKNTSRAAFCC